MSKTWRRISHRLLRRPSLYTCVMPATKRGLWVIHSDGYSTVLILRATFPAAGHYKWGSCCGCCWEKGRGRCKSLVKSSSGNLKIFKQNKILVHLHLFISDSILFISGTDNLFVAGCSIHKGFLFCSNGGLRVVWHEMRRVQIGVACVQGKACRRRCYCAKDLLGR